jgi:ubiquinone/menaquinone biosynthesis C-methylase UbiE
VQDAWFSYDGIALEYSAGAEQIYFADPAADLVRLLEIGSTGTLLDLGSGSGAVAAAAVRSGYRGRIVGCDASMAMLGAARKRLPEVDLVEATVLGLPFLDRTFDAVTGSFILSHLADVTGALAATRRVLKTDGRLGVTSWADSAGESAPGRLWTSIAQGFIPADVLQTAALRNLPSEDELATLDGLAEAISGAGFTEVSAEQKTYAIEVETRDFLISRFISMAARYMKAHLSPTAWTAFLTSAERAVYGQYGERLKFETKVNFVIGRCAA